MISFFIARANAFWVICLASARERSSVFEGMLLRLFWVSTRRSEGREGRGKLRSVGVGEDPGPKGGAVPLTAETGVLAELRCGHQVVAEKAGGAGIPPGDNANVVQQVVCLLQLHHQPEAAKEERGQQGLRAEQVALLDLPLRRFPKTGWATHLTLSSLSRPLSRSSRATLSSSSFSRSTDTVLTGTGAGAGAGIGTGAAVESRGDGGAIGSVFRECLWPEPKRRSGGTHVPVTGPATGLQWKRGRGPRLTTGLRRGTMGAEYTHAVGCFRTGLVGGTGAGAGTGSAFGAFPHRAFLGLGSLGCLGCLGGLGCFGCLGCLGGLGCFTFCDRGGSKGVEFQCGKNHFTPTQSSCL